MTLLNFRNPSLLFVIAAVLCLVACSDKPESKEVETSEDSTGIETETETGDNDYKAMYEQLKEQQLKDSLYMADMAQEIEIVYKKLERMNELEERVRMLSNDLQGGKISVKEGGRGIQENMEQILKQLEESRAYIRSLEKKLSSSGSGNKLLTKQMDHLKQVLKSENTTVVLLNDQLSVLEEKVSTLKLALNVKGATVNAQSHIIDNQKEKLNAGYYVVGKEKDLKKQEVIISASKGLTPKRDQSVYTLVDIKKDKLINLGAEVNIRKIDLVPTRPGDSYMLYNADGTSYLKITDYKRFWRDRYLAVVY